MAVDQSNVKRAEWKREMRQHLQTASPEEKRQFARTMLAAMLGAFGVHTRADQLTWRRFWGRFGFLWTLLWIGFLLAFIASGVWPGTVPGAIASVFLSAIFVVLGVRLALASLQPLWICLTGRVTRATVTSMHIEEGASGAPRSTPIVTFTTERGYQRSARLVERKERPLSDQLAREYPGDTSSTDEAAPLAIGTQVTIAYRAETGTATRVSIWSFVGGAMGLLCAAVVFALAGQAALSILKTAH